MAVSSHFEAQLVKGRKSESKVLGLLLDAGFRITNKGNTHRHDLCVIAEKNGLVFRVEIKNEDDYAASNNICIELRQGNPPKPSGLAISEATICIHTLGDRVALYRAHAMRLYLSNTYLPKHQRYDNLRSFGASDNSNCGVVLRRGMLVGHPWFDERDIQTLAMSPLWDE